MVIQLNRSICIYSIVKSIMVLNLAPHTPRIIRCVPINIKMHVQIATYRLSLSPRCNSLAHVNSVSGSFCNAASILLGFRRDKVCCVFVCNALYFWLAFGVPCSPHRIAGMAVVRAPLEM